MIRTNSTHQVQRSRRHRQASMPPPMWRNLQQGPLQSLAHSQQPQDHGGLGGRRQRALTMSDQLVTPSPSNTAQLSPYYHHHHHHHQEALGQPPTNDYFTYLSDHHQQRIQPHIINIQTSSPPSHPEISIPEIRLAPPNENQMTVPEFTDMRSCSSPLNSPGPSPRTRGSSTLSLAPPPSILSDCDSFVSARQSFLLSPSASFNHRNELQSTVDHARLGQEEPVHQRQRNQLTLPGSLSDAQSIHSYHHAFGPNQQPHHCCCDHQKILAVCSFINEMQQVLLPTLQGWDDKSLFSRVSAVAAVPLVFIFTITLPVAELEEMKVDDIEILDEGDNHPFGDVEDDHNGLLVPSAQHTKGYLSVPNSETDITTSAKVVVVDEMETKQGWNKYLLVAQCVISTTFIVGVLAGNALLIVGRCNQILIISL